MVSPLARRNLVLIIADTKGFLGFPAGAQKPAVHRLASAWHGAKNFD
jgi:hypothetical protein